MCVCRMSDQLNDAERKALAGQLSASLAALPNVERTPEQLMKRFICSHCTVAMRTIHGLVVHKARVHGLHHEPEDIEKKFWPRVDKSNPPCWLWTGHKGSRGYGRFGTAGGKILAHRYSYQIHNGPIPEGLDVCHTCDVPACVNPDHLWAGTKTDNMQDMIAKGRKVSCAGERHGCHKLKAPQVLEIRRLASTGVHQRVIAKMFNIQQGNVSFIVRGETWKNL